MRVKIEPSWHEALAEEWAKPYFEQLTNFVRTEYASGTVYPPANRIFAAFDLSPFNEVKVVILGQDPYHGPGQANGLCFSVNPGKAPPPSLVNIFKEVADDMGRPSACSADGNLEPWARQGVLLLNTALTVRAHQAGSHSNSGWHTLTDAAVRALSAQRTGIVFILWGAHAIAKRSLIDESRHLVLTSPHPSPLSAYRGFFGNKHFSRANSYLESIGKSAVQW